VTDLPIDFLEILACPRCAGPLVADSTSLCCASCRLVYRIEESIPVMLVGDAQPLDGP
jgi:uncharacterized protein